MPGHRYTNGSIEFQCRESIGLSGHMSGLLNLHLDRFKNILLGKFELHFTKFALHLRESICHYLELSQPASPWTGEFIIILHTGSGSNRMIQKYQNNLPRSCTIESLVSTISTLQIQLLRISSWHPANSLPSYAMPCAHLNLALLADDFLHLFSAQRRHRPLHAMPEVRHIAGPEAWGE